MMDVDELEAVVDAMAEEGGDMIDALYDTVTLNKDTYCGFICRLREVVRLAKNEQEKSAPVGNSAAMREALCDIVMLTMKVGYSIHGDVACGIIASKAKHALAAPPRNCDVPHKDGHELWVRWQNYCTEIFPSMVSFSTWLLAPAKKGGAK